MVRKVFWLESCAGILREIEGGMAVFTPRKHEKQVSRLAVRHLSSGERPSIETRKVRDGNAIHGLSQRH